MKRILYSMIIGFLMVSGTLWADTLELTNGKTIEGTFVGRAEGSVKFEVDGITTTYNEKDVKNISFGSSGEKSENKTETAATGGASGKTAAVTVPAGTMLMVRTKEPLDSRRQKAGHKFTSVLEADLVADGVVVAPRGSNVYGELIDTKQAGRLAGKSEITLTFTGLMINNQIKPIQTGAVQAVAESGQGKNTAGKVVRGAAIGGLVDGKSGARTGAKVGAGAALLTRGGRINIPANTLLEVPLANPLSP